MEEELKPEMETEVNAQTITSEQTQTKQENSLDNLPRLEDLLKSEKEVKTAPQIEGVTQVENEALIQDKPFAKKEDKKKIYLKRRVKIVAGVYASVVALLLAFVGVNAVSLALLNKDINTNTNTIQAQNDVITYLENSTPTINPDNSIIVSLNEPRDYSDDKKDLTFLDKLTIIFRSIFS